MLQSSKTFYHCACLKSITILFEYFVKRRKIVPVKECQVSFYMTGRCLLTSVFKIYMKFLSFFWHIICVVPKISITFYLSQNLHDVVVITACSYPGESCSIFTGDIDFWDIQLKIWKITTIRWNKSKHIYIDITSDFVNFLIE